MESKSEAEAWLEQLRVSCQARAAGLWRLSDGALWGEAYAFCDDFARQVADEFRAATVLVPLEPRDLGIVQAYHDRQLLVTNRAEGPAGSRGWLARFGAHSSWALPFPDGADVHGMLAVALGQPPADPEAFGAELRRRAAELA